MQIWQGKNISVEVLYSKAGIATQIVLTDKSSDDFILLDCGDGVTRDLIKKNIKLNNLKGILITHGHTDHYGGLYSLLFVLHLVDYKGELNIIAPINCNQVYDMIQLFLKFYGEKLRYTLYYNEIKDGVFESISNFIIKPFPALHYESINTDSKYMSAFGYRISIGDELVVYSGDTIKNPILEKEVEGVDLAILEATYDKDFHGKFINHLYKDYAEYLGKSAKSYFLIHHYDINI